MNFTKKEKKRKKERNLLRSREYIFVMSIQFFLLAKFYHVSKSVMTIFPLPKPYKICTLNLLKRSHSRAQQLSKACSKGNGSLPKAYAKKGDTKGVHSFKVKQNTYILIAYEKLGVGKQADPSHVTPVRVSPHW